MTEHTNGKIKERGKVVKFSLAPLFFMYYNHIKYAILEKGRNIVMKRVGFLTSGGDCQALNATMRGVAKALYSIYGDEVEIIGFEDGYKGLMYANYRFMSRSDFSGILTKGGTMLGTSRQPFKEMREPDENGLDKVELMRHTYYKLKLDALVVLGGNGSQKTSNLLSQEGLNVIGLPKTIDNDIWGTDITFGFQSAVDVATNAIDFIHTTASSHGRVLIVEIMGHKVGWLALHAGIAGGADIILLPEIPYDLDVIAKKIKERTKYGSRFSILAVAEGAISKEDAKLSKKEYKKKLEERKQKYHSVAYELGAMIQEKTGQEIRVTVPGHMQRGGTPVPYDRVISSRIGAHAATLIDKEQFGRLVVVKNNVITDIPLSESAGKLKYVDPKSDIIKEAKLLGISFGDE